MPSLNEIVYAITESLPEGSRSMTLIEKTKMLVLTARATLLRRDFSTNGTYPIQAVQNLGAIPTKLVDRAENCKIVEGCKVRRLTLELPEPARLKNTQDFTYVGEVGQHSPWTQVTMEEVEFRLSNKYTGKTPCYAYQNNTLYIYNATPTYVNVRGIFADPREAAVFNSCVGCDGYSDDLPLAIPADLADEIIRMYVGRVQPAGSDEVIIL